MRIRDWSSGVCSSGLHLDAGGVADDLVTILDLPDTANVEPDRGIEFACIAAGRGFGIAVHHADLHAQLVDEDHHALGTADRTGQQNGKSRVGKEGVSTGRSRWYPAH